MPPKKQFINKKKAAKFQVVHRSQHDTKVLENDQTATDYVLVPILKRDEENAKKLGLPDELFGEEEEPDLSRNPTALKILQDVPEVDPEILEALENADEFEELDDDFIIKANDMDPKMFKTRESQLNVQFEDAESDGKLDFSKKGKSEITSTSKTSKEEEDEDAEYEAWLARRAAAKERFKEEAKDGDEEDEEYDEDEEYEEYDEEEDEDLENSEDDEETKLKKRRAKFPLKTLSDYMPSTEERAILEARFEKIMAQYEDEEIGELEDGDPKIRGTESIANLSNVLDEFLQISQTKKELTPEEEQKLVKELIIKRLEKEDNSEEEQDELVEVEDEEAEKWDVESITSTYSNKENHPKLLDDVPKPKIQLSSRTGLPIGVLPTKKPKGEKKTKPKENKGKSRTKEETPEEKKARKKAVKEERKQHRENKKALKIAYKSEELQLQQIPKAQVIIPIGS